MTLKNDKDIIDEIIKVIDNIHSDKNIYELIPECIILIQQNYRHIRGSQKKALVLKIIQHFCIKKELSQEEQEMILLSAPFIIDSTVYLVKSSYKLFMKHKSRICCIKK